MAKSYAPPDDLHARLLLFTLFQALSILAAITLLPEDSPDYLYGTMIVGLSLTFGGLLVVPSFYNDLVAPAVASVKDVLQTVGRYAVNISLQVPTKLMFVLALSAFTSALAFVYSEASGLSMNSAYIRALAPLRMSAMWATYEKHGDQLTVYLTPFRGQTTVLSEVASIPGQTLMVKMDYSLKEGSPHDIAEKIQADAEQFTVHGCSMVVQPCEVFWHAEQRAARTARMARSDLVYLGSGGFMFDFLFVAGCALFMLSLFVGLVTHVHNRAMSHQYLLQAILYAGHLALLGWASSSATAHFLGPL